ncbi:hypothetical protein [Haladaptatus sp. NG-SE-30]
MTWREVLFISMWPVMLGIGYLLWPQKMFRLDVWPFVSASTDGLTEDGEQAYRRIGILWILFGVGFAVIGLLYL